MSSSRSSSLFILLPSVISLSFASFAIATLALALTLTLAFPFAGLRRAEGP